MIRLLKDLNLKPFRPTVVQGLLPGDHQSRVAFCTTMQNKFIQDPTLIDRILHSDEATFNLDGTVNRRNEVIWAEENPHRIIERHMKSVGLTVWAGMSSRGIIGSEIANYFLKSHIPL